MSLQENSYCVNWSTVLKNIKCLPQYINSAYAIQSMDMEYPWNVNVECKGDMFCFPSPDCIWYHTLIFCRDLKD